MMILAPESYDLVAFILILLGLLVAWLSVLEHKVAWVQHFCAFFGEGCRRTAPFTLVGIPIAWWGAGFYIALGALFFLDRPFLFWAVMAGLGIEATFVTIMVLIRAWCVFCILNSLVVALLSIFSFDLRRAGPAAGTALVSFALSLVLIGRENRLGLKKPSREDVLSEIEEETEEGKNPVLGPLGARVEVLEFTDYLCPHCRRARTMSTRLRREYRGRIRWVHMDFPLEMHPGAKELARVTRCAGDQGRFWAYQDLVLSGKARPGRDDLLGYARKAGLDPKRFKACLAGRSHADEVERDVAEGIEAGVGATPTFLVNGRTLVAPTYEEFKAAIDAVLATREPKISPVREASSGQD
jgi:protein-disulfide isomerase